MQAIALFAARAGARLTAPILAIVLGNAPVTAFAMELDHTDRIEQAAAETGCAVRAISDGKKRSGQMVYRVTCDENGTSIEREVTCKFNACTFGADDDEGHR